MSLTFLIPVAVLAVVLIAGFVWYRRAMRRLEPDDGDREVSGTRLTSEHLRVLPTPPWRVVFEIGTDRLRSVDHVVVGPPGAVAIATVMSDRPDGEIDVDPTLAAGAALTRADVDALLQASGLRCEILAKVFWGTPHPDRPPAVELSPGSIGVEGQRLREWLESLPATVTSEAQIDLAWQSVVTGIGRPDPM